MMAGAYVGQMAVTSDSAKKLGKIVEIKLEEVLDEATEQAKIKSKSINKPKE
jgi:ribosome-binding protein aMBF1 (putative translation factor)